MSTVTFVIKLDTVLQQINRYVPIFLLSFGLIGNLLNCLVFTRPIIRTNPCAIFFLAASLANFIILITAFTPRISSGWNPKANLIETVPLKCKINLFLMFVSRTIVPWMMAFATIDRYLLSSPNIHRRQMSNLKNTYRCIVFICIISIMVWFEMLICLDANLIGTPKQCFPKSKACYMYNNFAQLLIITIIPMTIMLIFGFGTIRNIHEKREIVPDNILTYSYLRNQRKENRLTKILLIQVLVMTLLSLPFAITTFCLLIISKKEKSLTQMVIESFVFSTLFLVALIPNCISLFLFTLSGSLFRETLIGIGIRFRQSF